MNDTGNLRKAKRKGEILRPASYIRTETVNLPGFRDEPASLLGFILRVLDGKHRRMVRQHLDCSLTWNPQIGSVQKRLSADPDIWLPAVDAMIATMREMADMWIDSGKDMTNRDMDTPAVRNVEDVLPGRKHSLFQMIDRLLLQRCPRYTGMRRDGSLEIRNTFPQFNPTNDRGLKSALEVYGAKYAAFYFSRLLDSRYSRRITRCDHCKRYFAYQKNRLRAVKNGVSCRACEGKASVKRTDASRDKRFETAATAWIESASLPRKVRESADELERRRKERVAEQVNRAHGTAFGRRWVSQNWNDIQKRLEALRNAKG